MQLLGMQWLQQPTMGTHSGKILGPQHQVCSSPQLSLVDKLESMYKLPNGVRAIACLQGSFTAVSMVTKLKMIVLKLLESRYNARSALILGCSFSGKPV